MVVQVPHIAAPRATARRSVAERRGDNSMERLWNPSISDLARGASPRQRQAGFRPPAQRAALRLFRRRRIALTRTPTGGVAPAARSGMPADGRRGLGGAGGDGSVWDHAWARGADSSAWPSSAARRTGRRDGNCARRCGPAGQGCRTVKGTRSRNVNQQHAGPV